MFAGLHQKDKEVKYPKIQTLWFSRLKAWQYKMVELQRNELGFASSAEFPLI
jgi:hypothetical protein